MPDLTDLLNDLPDLLWANDKCQILTDQAHECLREVP